MAKNAPGKAERRGLTIAELIRLFPDDAAAERWFTETRWPDGPCCPRCASLSVQTGAAHATMPMRCRDCRKRFSVKTGTAMEASNLGYQTWALATYLLTTSLKGVSSMKLHRDLGVSQKTAWHLAHRIRQAWADDDGGPLAGPVEVDEVYIGGREANKHEWKRERDGLTPKVAVIGVKDRATGTVRARVVGQAHGPVLRGFVRQHATPGAHVYSDGHAAYVPLEGEYDHRAVHHSAGTYVIEGTHTNGIESFWSMLRRGEHGTYHHWSARHLQRYVDEFAGRHNARPLDTLDQMRAIARGLVGKRLRFRELVA